MFLILFLSETAMIYSTDILKLIGKINAWMILIIMISVNLGYYYLIENNLLVIGNLSYYYMGGISGITMFIVLWKLFRRIAVGRFLTFISALSYQIYLVHHPLCNVNSVTEIVNSQFIAIISIVAASILLAYILKISKEFLVFRCNSIRIKVNSSKF